MPGRLPVRLVFMPQDSRQDAWGRIESLSPAGARLSTLCALKRRERVELDFEVNGERFEGLRAVVVHAETDVDGYCLADLDFLLPTDRRRLAGVLLDTLSRSSGH